MPRLKLTEKAVDRLKAPHPDGKQTLYWDTELRGFGVLCSGVSNARSYIVQRDLPNGRTRRVTIGPVNLGDALDLKKARTEAELILADMYKGIDPKVGRRGSATLRGTLADYLSARKDLREKTRTDYEASVTQHLAPWLDRPLREITPEMVENCHREIQREIGERAEEDRKRREAVGPAKLLLGMVKGDDHPSVKAAMGSLKSAIEDGDIGAIRKKTTALADAAVKVGAVARSAAKALLESAPEAEGTVKVSGGATANAAMRVLRILWNFAAERAEMPPNPVKRLRRQWYAVPRRERMVSADDLPKFYAAVQALPNMVARDYILLLLFTGLRREEAASLRWDDVDFATRAIRLPAARTKGDRKLDLPMTDLVRDMLVARRALGREEFVFPSDSAAGYIAEPKFPLGLVREATGISVSAHDLRRTFITIAESTDISPLALKALVNHSLGKTDVTAGYIQMSVDRLREPMQKICDRLKELCAVAGAGGASVARLPGQ